MSLGPLEILVVLVLALLVFGPKRLPEVGRQVGAALRELRRVQDQVRTEVSSVLSVDADHSPPRAPEPKASSPEADREPDHDEVPPTPDAEPAADVPASTDGSAEASAASGFEGPPGSFV